jgi:hypothetical protein
VTGTYSIDVVVHPPPLTTAPLSWSFSTPFAAFSSSGVGSLSGTVQGPGGDVNTYFQNVTPAILGVYQYLSFEFPAGDMQETGALATNATSSACNNESVYAACGVTGDYVVTGSTTLISASYTDLTGGLISAPVYLPIGPPIAGVTGTISGGEQEFYLLDWAGGAFNVTASITGANIGGSYTFSEGAATISGCAVDSSATLNSGDSFSSTISIADLPAGKYCVGLDANSPNDPAFTLAFNTLVQGGTPEPSSFLLLLAGLGMTGLLRIGKRG